MEKNAFSPRVLSFDSDAVNGFCSSGGSTEDAFFTTVFSLVLSRFAGSEDSELTIGTSGRDAKGETVLFAYHDSEAGSDQPDPEEVDAAMLLQVYKNDGKYSIGCEYISDIYEESYAPIFIDSFEKVATDYLAGKKLEDISILTPAMEADLDRFNDEHVYDDPVSDMVSMFRASAEKHADKPAVFFKDKFYTYREVDETSERIAAYLRSQGAGRGKVVSILIPRCEYMVMAAIGALKSGAGYQPLDPSYPEERLNFMMKDAQTQVLIADESLLDRVSEYKGPVLLTKDIPSLPACEKIEDHPAPEDMFILLYTSGTTGVPKGVILEHHNLCNFCYWGREEFGVDENTRSAAYASFGFDVIMMDTYPTLIHGGCVYIVEEDLRLDLVAMEAWFNQHKITHCIMTTQVARQFYTMAKVPTLKYLTAAGEKLAPVQPVDGETAFFNGYGPSECTIICTIFHVDDYYPSVPIGKALRNVKLYVVDKQMRRLPPYVPGELLIAGRGVGRGYLNRPEQTEKVFIKNPFSDDPDFDIAYRSGDIVYYLPDGNIAFIGRNDGQVKVRGFRIELTEVESIIREFDGIKDATVQAFEDETTGEKFIAAYVVSDSEVDVDAMNEFILSQKPPYMVPAVTMQIDSIPLNQNQKVNKRALPKPEPKTHRADTENMVAAPLNILEEEIRDLAAEIFDTRDFGIMDKFGDLGLTSISGIRLATQIYKKFDIQINVRELVAEGCIQSVENAVLAKLFDHEAEKSAAAQASSADSTASGAEASSAAGASSKAGKQSCRLSFAQQGVYTECQANPDAVVYNLPMAMKFPDGITEDQLKTAVQKVVDAHPYILCRFVADEHDEIVQEPIPDFKLDIPVSSMSPSEYEQYKVDFVRPFDLKTGPVVRFEIVHTDSLNLLFDMHHLVSDGASLDLFMEQLCQALDGVEIEKEEYNYYDFVADEKLAPEEEEYFAGVMSEMEDATRLIADVYEEGLPHTEKTTSVSTDLTKVIEFAKRMGVTPAAVYLAAAYITYARYVCEDTVAIATVSNGRNNLKLGNTLGMFVNTLPLVMTIDNSEKVSDFLGRVAKGFSDTIDHENYPFARIASKYDFHPGASYTYQIGVISEYSTKAGSITEESLRSDIAKLPVGIYIIGDEGAAEIQAAYDSAMYSEEMMQGLVQSVENVVRGLMSGETLGDISLTDEVQGRVLDGYNKPWDLDYDKADTAVTVFRRNVTTEPDKVAAVYRDKSYTYRELDELTDRLAAKIYKRACEVTGKTDLAEEVVAILLNRNENVFILPMAALKAGLAYEPLDPSYPKERLNFMVKDANCCLLIMEEELGELVDEYEGAVLTVKDLYSMEDVADKPQEPSPEDMFVMLYTSGSTGVPKGCQLEHRNLVSYAHGVRNDFYTHDDRIAAYASFGFDVNMSDVFCTLLNGGTVYLIPEDIRMDLGGLAAYFDEVGITALLLTTQVGVQFLQNYPKLKTLRMLVMGGEKLPAVDPSQLSYTIVNGYGPTENCCGVSLFPIEKWEPNVPIGKPMNTIHAYVLDKSGHRLPAGAAGEFCLSGPQVSRGYLNRPDKTAEAYESCPFNEFRMYHTGDIVRYRQNGDVEFVGRKDGQVKIRGFRIETKEVEAVIRGFDGINDVTVQAYDYEGGGKYLAAFVVGDQTVDTTALADYIKTQKPAYMVPAAIMQIDEIPLTVNQKVDKKALPEPKLQKAAYVAPVGKTEEDFCSIFGSVLGLEKVSAEDDFFDIGGSSVLAMKVVIAAEKAGYSIVYNDVFSHTTPRAMAEFLEGGGAGEAAVVTPVLTDDHQIPVTGRDGYDYTRINELLSHNTLEAFKNGDRLPLNDVLLFGGTGYLGSHVLHELITEHDNRIYCFVRPGQDKSGEQRLKGLLLNYFGDDYAALIGSRIIVIEGDATDESSLMAFKAPSENMTVINCAASVKHFARGNEIERTNVGSVRNIAKWCLQNNARLVHISTGSVAGSRENGMPPESFIFNEYGLYYGQVVDNNQYIHSKFMAERLVYEEIIEHSLRAKVFRVGNLAPRLADGVFQINYATNTYMNTFRAYQTMGIIPYDAMSEIVEFSPIDCLAKAVIALAGTPDECVCFIPINTHRPLMSDVIRAFEEEGYGIRGVESEEFEAVFKDALSDEKTRDAVSALAAYNSNDNTSEIGLECCDNSYTTGILERLGFSWPETGVAYMRRFLEHLKQKGFFGGDEV